MYFLVASDLPVDILSSRSHIPTIISDVAVNVFASANVAANDQAQVAASVLDPAEQTIPATDPSAAVNHDGLKLSEAEAFSPHQSETSDSILRVDSSRIDAVLNLVGELIIGKSILQQALNELARAYPKDPIRGRFSDAMAFQARVLGDLQRSVMKIRMVPVSQLFRRFPRMVRDVAKRCGKEVDLILQGQDTDLDKSLLDAIAEPLTHIVRNCVSHGIETPEERRASGKPEKGAIRLDAYHHASQVVVSVSDDGRGIDLSKVRLKAVKQGVFTKEEAARLTEAEVTDLVFRPGFSTAEEVTEISGRGVGLDVVRTVLQSLKGTVEVQTEVGKGTTFLLRLPLTLAIIKALLFRVEQRLYAIPLNAVAEITRAHESDLHNVDGYEVLQLRNEVLPLMRMGRAAIQRENSQVAKIFVLVIATGGRKLGLIVDSLEGEEELVIKALDDQTVTTDLVSGASILGDGRVVLIMNLAAIIERFSRSRKSLIANTGLLLSGVERQTFAAAPVGSLQ